MVIQNEHKFVRFIKPNITIFNKLNNRLGVDLLLSTCSSCAIIIVVFNNKISYIMM